MNTARQAVQSTVTPQVHAVGLLQRQCACGQHSGSGGECEECKKKRAGTLQRAAISLSPVHEVPPIVYEVLHSPGQPLDAETRAFMEPRFGHDLSRVPLGSTQSKLVVNAPDDVYEREADSAAESIRSAIQPSIGIADQGHRFGHVRVHTDTRAAASARALNSHAYTVGRNIVFAAGQFQPHTATGQRLLAHELAHVLQQSRGPDHMYSGESGDAPIIQRSRVPTHFGEFEDFRYQDLTDSAGTKIGVEMYMKFHPGNNVRADLIGMTQQLERKINGTQDRSGIRDAHSATRGAGVGSYIDQLEGAPNPLYAATTLAAGGNSANLADYQTLGITPLTAAQQTAEATATGVTGVRYTGFGQHGYRKVVAGAFVTQPAELYDTPNLGASGANSEQVFETTALAIAGPQSGTYYGSVEWGWRRDAAGRFTRLPLRVVSQGVPSVTFLTAANIWNQSNVSFGFIATSATNLLDASLTVLSAIPNKAELAPTGRQATGGGATYFEVTYGGNTGFVVSTAVRPAAIGAATVDLPIPMIHKVSNPAGTTMILLTPRVSLIPGGPPTTTLALPVGTRITTTRCMAPTAALPNHYEGEVVDGPFIGTRGYFSVPDLAPEALGTR